MRQIQVLVAFAFCAALHAQINSGQIAGYVRDSSESVFAGALVTVTNAGTNDSRSAVANSGGYYVVVNVGGTIGTFDPDSVSNGGFSINGGRADEYVVTVDGALATRTRSSGSKLGVERAGNRAIQLALKYIF